jgi:hypothetical protein
MAGFVQSELTPPGILLGKIYGKPAAGRQPPGAVLKQKIPAVFPPPAVGKKIVGVCA